MKAPWTASIPGQMVAGHKRAPQAMTAVGDGKRVLVDWKQQSRAGENSPSSTHISRIDSHRGKQRVDKKMSWTSAQVPAGLGAGRSVTDWDSQLGQGSSLAKPIPVRWSALLSPPQEALWRTALNSFIMEALCHGDHGGARQPRAALGGSQNSPERRAELTHADPATGSTCLCPRGAL